MAIDKTSLQERSWGDVFDVVDRVVDELNTGAGGASKAVFRPQLTGGEPPTEAEFNALLTALKNAGLMASS